MITREQVADLQPGDVVEIRHEAWPDGTLIRGPLTEHPISGALMVAGDVYVRRFDGSEPAAGDYMHLTVVSRAPRPLYVNHPRTEAIPGDVVRDADDDGPKVWMRASDVNSEGIWLNDIRVMRRDKLPARLRLLVDGETGQVVP